MKRLFLVFCCIATVYSMPARADDGPFLDYAIEDSAPADITTASVSMNMDAGAANVSTFDIAGIMLGMPFEDVQTLFFKGGGLYAPREKNSIIYTINPDWKYNLDYECRQQNIFAPDELENCIRTLARHRGLMYASELHLLRSNVFIKNILPKCQNFFLALVLKLFSRTFQLINIIFIYHTPDQVIGRITGKINRYCFARIRTQQVQF